MPVETIRTIFKIGNPKIFTDNNLQLFTKAQNLVLENPYVFRNPKGLVGLEIEVENVLSVDPNLTLMFWNIKEDGSLRNNGREFVIKGAIPIGFVESALRQLDRGLNPDRDFSIRTSVHVHQDVRGMTLEQLTSLILIYITVESILFKFAENNRKNSIYCVPITQTELLNSITQTIDMKHIVRNIDSFWLKYSALNLLPIKEWGSIEYRHMPGTLDIQKLLVWIDLISRIKIAAYKWTIEDLHNRIFALNTNSQYYHFLEDLFGSLVTYLDVNNLIRDMESNVFYVKHCAIVNDFHKKVITSSVPGSMLDPTKEIKAKIPLFSFLL